MKIAHECPLAIFDKVQAVTDYDYFLVHLYEENEEYLQKAIEAVQKGRHVILDNSVFELESAFDSDRFLYWINKVQPTEYIIPDVLEDSYSTLQRLGEWKTLYEPLISYPAKTIGVVQGRNFDDIVWCYQNIAPLVDKIAISFDYSFMCPEKNYTPASRCEVFMRGRQHLIKDLLKEGVIDTSKPHHLLGCYSAAEFVAYRDYKWIDTIDTSNPVIAGYFKREYVPVHGGYGLSDKPMQKLHTIMDSYVSDEQLVLIMENIDKFKLNL